MPRRVLIVDDNRTVREVLEVIFSLEPDVEVCAVAHNATAAVMLAGELEPDVVVLDYEMPGTSGLDILPTILHEAPRTTVFMYSACDDLAAINQARNSGAAGYFVKGVDDIDRVVEAVCARVPESGDWAQTVSTLRPRGATRAEPAA